jgi:hypothetical protein
VDREPSGRTAASIRCRADVVNERERFACNYARSVVRCALRSGVCAGPQLSRAGRAGAFVDARPSLGRMNRRLASAGLAAIEPTSLPPANSSSASSI